VVLLLVVQRAVVGVVGVVVVGVVVAVVVAVDDDGTNVCVVVLCCSFPPLYAGLTDFRVVATGQSPQRRPIQRQHGPVDGYSESIVGQFGHYVGAQDVVENV